MHLTTCMLLFLESSLKRLQMNQVAHQAIVIPVSVSSMKQLGIICTLPMDGMLIHCEVAPPPTPLAFISI